ncbi:MAG TPA: Dyp-type peroxidase [Deltaproteobacteria bacterium]|nr:Dyp-type peroxidase [Deltaproteobacteria bacterium]
MRSQPAVLADVPSHASFVFLQLRHGHDPVAGAGQLAQAVHPDHLLVGLGSSLLGALGCTIPGMRPLPALSGSGIAIPTTPSDLLLRISGDDPGEVLHREREIQARLPAFEVSDQVCAFMYGPSRDLSGYEDGTENPTGAQALAVAIQSSGGPGLEGSSVVAVQRWVHDLGTLGAMDQGQQDAIVGRSRETNEELGDAPETAHIRRTAQEDFEPEAFLVRRSMPWRDRRGAGLMFVSFSATLDPFEAQLRRMVGLDDGLVDALFTFTRPVSGGTWWCPPLGDDRLELRACLP